MGSLVSLLLLAAAQTSGSQYPLPAPPRPQVDYESTLINSGWKQLWVGERGKSNYGYYHPRSIRRATDDESVYSVTAIFERLKDKPGSPHQYYVSGNLVNCAKRTFVIESSIDMLKGQPMPQVFLHRDLSNADWRTPRGFQAVMLEKVCEDR